LTLFPHRTQHQPNLQTQSQILTSLNVRNGVYYGNRFGAKLGPWVTGFPFNVPNPIGRHPQYFGVLCTMWGLVCLVPTPAALAAGLVPLAAVWSCFYAVTSAIEQEEDNTSRVIKTK